MCLSLQSQSESVEVITADSLEEDTKDQMTDSSNTATGEFSVFQMNKSICIIYLHRWVTKDKHCLTAIILKPG